MSVAIEKTDPRFAWFEGKVIGYQAGTVSADHVYNKVAHFKTQSYTNYVDLVVALKSGKIDAFATDEPCARHTARVVKGLKIHPVKLSSVPYVMAFDRTKGKLVAEFNKVLDRYKKEGILEKLQAIWFGTDESLKVINTKPKVKKGTIVLGADTGTEPMVYQKGGQLVGYEIDIATRILTELGYEVKCESNNWEALLPALVSHKIDMVVSTVVATPERGKQVLFSRPHYEGGMSLLVRDDVPIEKDLTPFDRFEGKKIGFVTGTLSKDFFSQVVSNFSSHYYASESDLALALKKGKINAFVTEIPMATVCVNNVKGIEIYPHVIAKHDYAIALNKKHDVLRQEFNKVLNRFKKEGVLKELETIWLGKDESRKVPYRPTKELKKTLHCAVDFDLCPMIYMHDGQLMGYEVDLVTRIAEELGYRVEYTGHSFPSILPALASGKADIAVALFVPSPERRKNVLFTESHFSSAVCITVASDKKKDVKGGLFESFTNQKIGYVAGKHSSESVKTDLPAVQKRYFASATECLHAYENQTIDAFVLAEPEARIVTSASPLVDIYPHALTRDNYVIVVNEKKAALKEAIDGTLNRFKLNGVLAHLEDAWFAAGEEPQLPKVKPSAKKLKIVFTGGSYPMSYFRQGELVGFEVALIHEIAAALGMEPQMTVVDEGSILKKVKMGDYDIAVNMFSSVDVAGEGVLSSLPYYEGGTVLVTDVTRALRARPTLHNAFTKSLKGSFHSTFVLENRYKLILSGLKITLLISFFSVVFAVIWGGVICWMKLSHSPLCNNFSRIYIRILQGTPLLVFLLILYYIVFARTNMSPVLVAIIAFGMNSAAYCAEMFASGIRAVDDGQLEAAYALGFTRVKTFCLITLPQATRHVLPVFKGEVISTIKMTSIVGYVAIQDLTRVGDIIRSRTYEAFFPLLVTAAIYFAIAFLVAEGFSLLESRFNPRRKVKAPTKGS